MESIQQKPLNHTKSFDELSFLEFTKPKESVLINIDHKKNWREEHEYTFDNNLGTYAVTEDGKTLLNKIFNYSYTFDTNEVPKYLNEMLGIMGNRKHFTHLELNISIKNSETNTLVYVLCRKENTEASKQFIEILGNILIDKTNVGWYSKRNDLLFFTDNIMFENFANLLDIK